jgi:hypothetical protein
MTLKEKYLMLLDEIECETNVEVDIKAEPKEKKISVPVGSSLVDKSSKIFLSSFDEFEENKLAELKKKLEEKINQLSKLNSEIDDKRIKAKDFESEIELLISRIDSFEPKREKNNYYFSLSEKNLNQAVLTPEVEELIRQKLSKIREINLDNFMRLMLEGEFKVKIMFERDEMFEEIFDVESLPKNIFSDIKLLGIFEEDGQFYYVGDLTYAQLANKLEKMGFTPLIDEKFLRVN